MIEKRRKKINSVKEIEGFRTVKGTYSKVHSNVKYLIKKFAEKTETKHYYIGATEDLDTRWSKYKDWQYKQVIYETSSYEIAKKAEEDLIKFANRTYDNCNKIPHSKGLKEGAKIYYIYMLGDKACKLRN